MARPHKHMTLDAVISKAPKDEPEMIEFLKKLITNIGMVVAELSNGQPNPIAWYCGDPDNQGMTAGGILTTSHVMLHVWDAGGTAADLHFDLYSCSDFEPYDILKKLDAQFGIVQGDGVIMNRRGLEVTAFHTNSLPIRTMDGGPTEYVIGYQSQKLR